MTRITDLRVFDLRFPTSQSLDGSDAMNPDPDYSAAYVLLETDRDAISGHALTFPIGRRNDICCLAIEATQCGDEGFRSAFWWTWTATVERIANQRMRDMGHMHADLVSTPGFQTQTQTRMGTEVFHNAIMRRCRFTHRVYRHMRALG